MKTLLTLLLCLFILSCETPHQKQNKATINLFQSLTSTDSVLACEVIRLTKENQVLQAQIVSLTNTQEVMIDNVEEIVKWIDTNSR